MNSKLNLILVLVITALIAGGLYFSFQTVSNNTHSDTLLYKNSQYGFTLTLPKTWSSYKVTEEAIQYGESVTLRHPLWTSAAPRMNIPILIYPLSQWQKWETTNFDGYPTAAPIGPTERGRNNKYVFATAPRYNYSFAEGFEEVENIIQTLKGFDI